MEGERVAINSKLFTDWVHEVFSKEKGYRKLLLEDSELRIWYAKHWHPTTEKCGRESIEQDLSRLVPGSVITLDDWELENDDDDDGDDYSGRSAGRAGRVAGGDGWLGS